MRDPFWQSAKILLNYKRPLIASFCGALVSATCFGAGIGTMMIVLKLLLREGQSVSDIIREELIHPDRATYIQELGRWLVDHVPDDRFYTFLLVMGLFAVMTVVGSLGRYTHEFLNLTVIHRAGMVWRSRMFRHLIHTPFAELLHSGSADHMSRVIFDTRPLINAYRAILGKSVEQILRGAAAVMTALYIDMRLTLIALIAVPPIAILLRKFGKRVRRASKRALQQRGRMIGALREAIGGIHVVRVHNAEGYERRRFGRINRRLYKEEMKIRTVRAMASPLIDSVAMISVVAVACIAAWYIFDPNSPVPPENFITVLMALGLARGSLKPLANINNRLNEGRAAAQRMLELLAMPVEPTGPHAQRNLPSLGRHRKSIVFDDVSFSYLGHDNRAIDHVSLQVEHGQTIAIVGGNGSGKTTLLSHLPRLLEPEKGRVLIDGVDIAQVRLRSLREQMAVVTQQTILFEGTIAENIIYGRRFSSNQQIVAAAKAAFADEFIMAQPSGYETMLGEQGVGLSGGQCQRLAIARAILRNPAILILDEATSEIDTESEAQINQALAKFRRDRTVFIIAHRLSTVVDSDLTVVLDAGRLIDQGKHHELLRRCELYQTLTHGQLQTTASVAASPT